MALDPRFVTAPDLQTYFVNKDNGLPNSNGYVKFFRDTQRTLPKNVYQLTGSPPDYEFTTLGATVRLSSVGTPQDSNGADIIIYYFPYDGIPGNTTNSVELYYIEVYDSNDVLQFTRSGWPSSAAGTTIITNNVKNYVPNGQFRIHTNYPSNGLITKPITDIAQGGWTFERPEVTTSQDAVYFDTLPAITLPQTNPRFVCNVSNITPNSTDIFKDLRLKFTDVNKFASESLQYTFSFTGVSLTPFDIPVQIILIKNFGTGGSPSSTTERILSTVTLGTSYPNIPFNITFVFGTNTGHTIGTNNDDFIQLAFRFPTATSFQAQIVDIALTDGASPIIAFPVEPDAWFTAHSCAGWQDIPDPQGFSYYLPVVNTAKGQTFDASRIGCFLPSVYLNSYAANFPVLLCDGSSYFYNSYSNLGIPYARLGRVFLANSPIPNIPMWGTGKDFITCYSYSVSVAANRFRLVTNNSGLNVSNATPGTTGWTFTPMTTPNNNFGVNAFSTVTANTFLITDNLFGSIPLAFTENDSGFTFTRDTVTNPGTQGFNCLTTSGAYLQDPGGAGRRFGLTNTNGQQFYFWYRFTTEEDPHGPGTGVMINLPNPQNPINPYTAQDIANITKEAINAVVGTTIQVDSLPAPGQYFTFNSNPPANTPYFAWYKVGLLGDPPSIPGTGIQISINGSGETTTTVTNKTIAALNQYKFAVPNLAGMFLRGFDPNGIYDADVTRRLSNITGVAGAQINTFQLQQFLSHIHDIRARWDPSGAFTSNIVQTTGAGIYASGSVGTSTPLGGTVTVFNAFAGGNETRPDNAFVNWYIYY